MDPKCVATWTLRVPETIKAPLHCRDRTLEELKASSKSKGVVFYLGYYGTHSRVRLFPPFGYSILYAEYYLTGFNRQKNATHAFFGAELELWGISVVQKASSPKLL